MPALTLVLNISSLYIVFVNIRRITLISMALIVFSVSSFKFYLRVGLYVCTPCSDFCCYVTFPTEE